MRYLNINKAVILIHFNITLICHLKFVQSGDSLWRDSQYNQVCNRIKLNESIHNTNRTEFWFDVRI